MRVNRKFDFSLVWEFCWDLSIVISGGNCLFRCDCVFSGGTFYPSVNYVFLVLGTTCMFRCGVCFSSIFSNPSPVPHWGILSQFICMMTNAVCFLAFGFHYVVYVVLYFHQPVFLSQHHHWDCSGTRTHNHLVYKWTLNHMAKLAKWLSCVVSTYLYSAFDCVFLSCHICVSEWIHTL